MIYRLLTTLFSAFICLSCASDNSSSPQEISIAQLKSLCRGDHYRIVNDYTIRGVVIATDWLGELGKSVILVDKSGGIEVAVDDIHLSEHLPIYSEVTILCNGLMLARIGGKIELGAAPTGDFPLDNINGEMLNRYIRIVGVCEDFAPVTKRFMEIGASDISAIVRLEDIRICNEEAGLAWCDTDENGSPITTYRTFVDSEGVEFPIRTLASCIYALEEIPTNEITVIGVIDFSDNRYFLRVVNKWIIPVFR